MREIPRDDRYGTDVELDIVYDEYEQLRIIRRRLRRNVAIDCGVCGRRKGHDEAKHRAHYERVKAADAAGKLPKVAP